MLKYFHERPQENETAAGYIVIEAGSTLHPLPPRGFCLITSKLSFNLMAETAEDAEQWLLLLHRAISRAKSAPMVASSRA
jgi:hypothetical protein